MPRLKLISLPLKLQKPILTSYSVNISDDLEKIYQAAFDSGHYTAALKAKELQMKIQHNLVNNEMDIGDNLCNLDDDQLKKVINMLEKKILNRNI